VAICRPCHEVAHGRRIPTATTGDIYFSDVLTGVLFKGIQG
jgi:hypothetical protein